MSDYRGKIARAVDIAVDGRDKEKQALAGRLAALRDRLASSLGLAAEDLFFFDRRTGQPARDPAAGLEYEADKVAWVTGLAVRVRVLLRYEMAFHYNWETDDWRFTLPGCIQGDGWQPLDGHEAGVADWLANVTVLALRNVRLDPGVTDVNISEECRKQGHRLHESY